MFPRGKQSNSGHRRPSGRLRPAVILTGCALFGGSALPALADQGTKQSFANIEQISDVLARTRLAQTRLAQSGAGNQVKIVQEGKDLVVDAYVQGQMNRANEQGQYHLPDRGWRGSPRLVSLETRTHSPSLRMRLTDPGQNKAYVTRSKEISTIQVFGRRTILVRPSAIRPGWSQTGNGNSGTIAQTVAPGTLAAAENFAAITQTGDDNSALIEQTGADNSATIEQDGDDNRGAILQDGEGLSAILVQTGTALEYTINQTGCVDIIRLRSSQCNAERTIIRCVWVGTCLGL